MNEAMAIGFLVGLLIAVSLFAALQTARLAHLRSLFREAINLADDWQDTYRRLRDGRLSRREPSE
jgi:ATP-dependent protease HslVU (ClpYQ) peptidase subunit